MIRQRFPELSIAVVHCVEAMRVVRQSAGIPQAVLKLLGEAARSESATYWTLERVDSRPQVRAGWGVPPIQAATRDFGLGYSPSCRPLEARARGTSLA